MTTFLMTISGCRRCCWWWWWWSSSSWTLCGGVLADNCTAIMVKHTRSMKNSRRVFKHDFFHYIRNAWKLNQETTCRDLFLARAQIVTRHRFVSWPVLALGIQQQQQRRRRSQPSPSVPYIFEELYIVPSLADFMCVRKERSNSRLCREAFFLTNILIWFIIIESNARQTLTHIKYLNIFIPIWFVFFHFFILFIIWFILHLYSNNNQIDVWCNQIRIGFTSLTSRHWPVSVQPERINPFSSSEATD